MLARWLMLLFPPLYLLLSWEVPWLLLSVDPCCLLSLLLSLTGLTTPPCPAFDKCRPIAKYYFATADSKNIQSYSSCFVVIIYFYAFFISDSKFSYYSFNIDMILQVIQPPGQSRPWSTFCMSQFAQLCFICPFSLPCIGDIPILFWSQARAH